MPDDRQSFKKALYCSFCGASQHEVAILIAGPNAFICDKCIETCLALSKNKISNNTSDTNKLKVENNINNNIINNNKHEVISKLNTPKEIKDALDGYIVNQDNAKIALAVAVYNHYKRINNVNKEEIEIAKSNILLIGPTGSGKTLLAQVLAKFLNVPFAIADATTLTEAGYVGDDVENVILRLLQNADFDVAKAERGIIYIDEIDKIGRKGDSPSITRDVSGEGVQQALLKIIEGTVASIPKDGSNRKHPNQECILINTSNILFICGGAFEGLDKIIQHRISDSSIGFAAEIRSKDIAKRSFELIKQVTSDDLIKFGLIPEFIGRLPIVSVLEQLTEADLKTILTKPKNAITKQFARLLQIDNIEIEFSDDALDEIAKKAIEKKSGARSLRAIMEEILLQTMFDAPSDTSIKKIIINKQAVIDKKPVLIQESSTNKIAS